MTKLEQAIAKAKAGLNIAAKTKLAGVVKKAAPKKARLVKGDTVAIKDRMWGLVDAKGRLLMRGPGVPAIFSVFAIAKRWASDRESGERVIRLNDITGIVQ